MEAAGIIRRSSSLSSSPLHMVKKSDGSWRPCGDYRRFNTVTVPDRYHLPSVSDFFTKISGSILFFKLDLQKGYYFGVRNVAQMFQRMMDDIFGDLPFCFIYLDDILIYFPDLASHQDYLQQVLQLCRDHGITINLDNHGHCVSASGSTPFQKYCSAISQFPCPVDRPSLQRFQ